MHYVCYCTLFNIGDRKMRTKGSGYIFKRGSIYYLELKKGSTRSVMSLKVAHYRDKLLKDGSILKGAETLARGILDSGSADMVQRITKDKEPPRIKLPLQKVFDHFEEQYKLKHTVSNDTFMNYIRQWNRFHTWLEECHPEIKGLEQITEIIANEYWTKIKDFAASTANQHLITLKAVFKTHVRDIPVSPWENIAKLPPDGISREYLTEAQRDQLFASFSDEEKNATVDPEYELLFWIGRTTGLRLADACLFDFSQIDFHSDIVRLIPRKTQRYNKEVIIPLFADLKMRLQALPHQSGKVLKTIASDYINHPDKVTDEVTAIFQRAGFKTNVKPDNRKQAVCVIGFHSFRGTLATDLLAKGIPIPIVSTVIGDNIQTIQKHYLKVNPQHIREAFKKIK